MVDKIAGLARLIATLLAIVAGFVAIPNLNVALALVVLGLVAGLKYKPENLLGLFFVVVSLPLVGAALANIPAIGAQLNAVALNIELAAASVAATVIAMRLYNNSVDDVTGLAGSTGGAATPAKA
ncbi:MAG: hypothetical protein J2O44_06950 [Porphyrobacter sp.]|nr:hypothetical protein [Porphyrobacter sp.]